MTTESVINVREPTQRVRWGIYLIFVAIVPMYGAVKVGHTVMSTSGGATSFRFDHLSLSLMMLASSVMALSVFIVATARVGWMRIFALGPALLGLLIAVGSIDAARQHVTIAPDRLVVPQRGLLSRPYLEVKYSNLVAVIHDSDGREVEFFLKGGTRVKVPRGDLMTAALPSIANALRANGVAYGDSD